jgi:eukaryotic-like serine/threonine-protein kinase
VSLVEGDVVVRAEARVGSVLRGKYRLERVLGVGGMAAVYAATHRNSKRFAVKVLHPELSLQSDVRTRFLREGYAATQVNHPGAVAIIDDDVAEDGSAFLVMELLEGETVDMLWEKFRWKLPAGAVLALAHQLLDVLAAAHANGIVHRDIKPENLFLTTEGQVKVLDFGIARLKDVANSTLTGAGYVMGTPAFMAPEQALGRSKEIDAQSDLWAAGAVFFSLLSGRFVHEAENSQAIVVKCATQPARSLAELVPGAPKDLVQLIDSALAFKKSARWQTATAMKKGVEAAAYAVLGGGPSRGALMKLFNEPPPADNAVVRRPDEVDPAALASDPGEQGAADADAAITDRREHADVTASASAQSAPDSMPEAQRRIGRTTDQPVAHDPSLAPRWLSQPRVLGAAAAGVAVASILAAVAMRGKPTDRTAPAPSASGASGHAESAAASQPVGPPPAPASAAAVNPPVPEPSQEPAPSAPAPAAPAHLPVAATAPAAPPVRPAPAAHAAAPAAVAPPAANQIPSSCTPPFTLDPVSGKKKWKPECL